MKNQTNVTGKVVISGSFKKYYSEIVSCIEEFEKHNWLVLSPKNSKIINPESDFIILESDSNQSIKQIEDKHLDAIRDADILYVVNPEGYIGVSASFEIGWALSCGTHVFLKYKPAESIFEQYCKIIETPIKAIEKFTNLETDLIKTITYDTSISRLQKYISKVVIKRGFGDESTSDILLLMVEEVGELAKAIRKHIGLKVDVADNADRRIASELADVLIYLLDLANSCNVDLAKALLEKEAENEKRHWRQSLPKEDI